MAKPPYNPHDGLFKALTDDQEAVTALVRDHLPASMGKRVVAVRHADTRLLESRKLAATQSDCLLEVTLDKGERALVYALMEHKAHPDPRVLLQVLGYMVSLWERIALNDIASLREPPLIIPMIFYHGKTKWEIPRSLQALHTEGQERFGMELHCVAVNLSELPMAQRASHPRVRALFHTMLHISGTVEGESYDIMVEVFKLLSDSPALTAHVVTYVRIAGVLAPDLLESAMRQQNPKQGDQIMHESTRRLMAQGQVRTLTAALTHKFGAPLPEDVQSQIAEASPEDIDAWNIAAMSAPTLAAVFHAKPST